MVLLQQANCFQSNSQNVANIYGNYKLDESSVYMSCKQNKCQNEADETRYMPVGEQNMANTSIWLKLKVVIWKNFTIRKHHWFLTLCEVLIPIVLFVLIAYVRSKVDILGKHYIKTPTYNVERSEQIFYYEKFRSESKIFYTPKTEFTEELIRQVQLKLTLNNEAIEGFNSESELIMHYETFARNQTVMGVVFKNIKGSEMPKQLSYAIRPFEKDVFWDTVTLFSSNFQYAQDSGSSNYIFEGFIAMQMALDTSFVEMASNKPLGLTLLMQEFPYPPHLNDAGATDMFLTILPLVTIFSFVFLCPAMLKRVAEEKSTGIKELMKMMGLKSWMLWLGWFIHAFVVNFISIIIITLVMKVRLFAEAQYAPIEYCDASLFFVFLILYCCASIIFCFAISSLFNKPNIAMIFGIFAWILSYSVPSNWIKQSSNMRWIYKMLLALFPNAALDLGYQAISIYETREVGASWGNLFKSPSGGRDDITMGNVFIMFIIDMVVFMLITLYIENVKPGPYGLAKPFHFPISYFYDKVKKSNSRIDDHNEEEVSKQYCKIEASNLQSGIEIRNLYKKYGKQSAVNGLSIDIYEGQITALLGHNGAGKTTTMSIITGMIGATSGKVFIDEKDIQYNMDQVRSSLGLCPQHNLQFADLTVFEHLIFFAMLKGLSKAEAEEDAKNLLKRMNLYVKRNSLASSLSGGMRRKLSLGIALIGNSKVLILDEPTSGLDPEARREIWDMLLSLRGSRTILITTHFMEEADVLGDRIAIMDHGRLICYGTSMFLKNEYGTGYHLTIIRDEEKFNGQVNENGNQASSITHVVQGKVKDAVLKTNSANHLTYLLPHETKPLFSELLLELESQKNYLGIINISMSVTTLEEVFLRVGNMVTKEDNKKDGEACNRNSIGNCSVSSAESTNSRGSHSSVGSHREPHVMLQLKSLLKKRFCVTKKKILVFSLHAAVAVFITFLTLYLGETITDPSSETFQLFDFNLKKYGETSVFYAGNTSNSSLKEMQRHYDKLVSTQSGNPTKVESVSDAIIKEGIKNIAYYKSHMVVSAEFNETTDGEKFVNAMYSNTAMHGAPISLNLVMNSILKSIMGDQYSIATSNHPLPMLIGNSLEEASEIKTAILWFIWFPLGMLFLSGAFIIFPHMERVSNVKQLQLMCGVRSVWYWLMCYIFDLFLYVMVVTLILICIVLYGLINSNMFSNGDALGALFCILLAYGLSIIPYAYIFSYKKSAGGALASFLIISMFASIVLTIVVEVMELSQDDYYEKLGNRLKHVLFLFPQFGLAYTTVQFSRKTVWNHNWDVKPAQSKATICQFEHNPCCDGLNSPQCIKYRSYFSGKDSINANILEMAASFTIYFTILLILETNFAHKLWNQFLMFAYNKTHPKNDVPDGKHDKDDVLNEKNRVFSTLEREKKHGSLKKNHNQSHGDGDDGYLNSTSLDTDEDLLLVHNLEKAYWGQKVVKGVSFGVKPGDCFGLLGVNGAGKTTTFRMLTGDEPVITGDARILDTAKHLMHISKETKQYLENVGYCPQFDALNEVLTGREMLTLFAELRGISSEVEQEVNYWISSLGLKEYADKPCGEYSGGNKRKLSMALALIGSPLLVMLDEPTSGVDPVSRRKLWDTLTAIQKQVNKPSVLLTSHSMEECEALCNKLAIMKAGQLECYGTIPQLKQKYGQGFTVMLKLKPVELTVTVVSLTPDAVQNHVLTRNNQPACKNTEPSVIDSEELKSLMSEFEEKYQGFCTLRDKHSGLLHYHISDKSKRWSELFSEIEALKQHHSIVEDYSISETTLEETKQENNNGLRRF